MHYRQWERANGKGNSPSSQWGPRRRANWKKRHANKRGSTHSETIYEVSIYDRDGWTCGICGLPVDRTLAWPDPMSASLDHRQPLSQGGTHTRDNVQCSHFACNAKKGAKPPLTLTQTPV
ncbi:hypothetical protein DEI83_06245 [Curtobacterium sp. MCBD17_021]|nr:hypothetical protein DEI83_06245 [Curtobacterium sp. MCBD17_021]